MPTTHYAQVGMTRTWGSQRIADTVCGQTVHSDQVDYQHPTCPACVAWVLDDDQDIDTCEGHGTETCLMCGADVATTADTAPYCGSECAAHAANDSPEDRR